MNLKRMSLPALAIATLLLTVGCGSTSNQVKDDTNQINDNSTVESTTNSNTDKYLDNIEVKAFFELAEKAKDMTSQEFIEAIKALDTENTLSIERTDDDFFLSAWYSKLYTLKTEASTITLRVNATESDGLEEIEDDNSVYSLDLMFNEENVIISYYVQDNSYHVTLEGEEPIILNNTLNKYKETGSLDQTYLTLQERFKDNKNITMDEIKTLTGLNELEIHSGMMQFDPEDLNIESTNILKEDGRLDITLLEGKELINIVLGSEDISYGYERADYTITNDETVKGNKYWFAKDGLSKEDAISFLKQVF